jgi:ABC-type branched-subunit amino acid transport system ATPase component
MPLFECIELSKAFGGLQAVDDLTFHVNQHEIVSIIGPNGAGKTTVFNLISGFYRPDTGLITLDGDDITGLPSHLITKKGIARTFQNVRLFFNMSIMENVLVGQHTRAKGGVFGAIVRTPGYKREQERARETALKQLSFFGTRLAGYRQNQPANVLSYANRRRLEIARAMATEPKLLLLDEPAAGMNPRETLEMADNIRRLRDERGFTILAIEHDMKVVGGISDRVIAMDYGKKIAEGSYKEVTDNPLVIEAYLGTQGGSFASK